MMPLQSNQPTPHTSLYVIASRELADGLLIDLWGTVTDVYEVEDVTLSGRTESLAELISNEDFERFSNWCNEPGELISPAEFRRQLRAPIAA